MNGVLRPGTRIAPTGPRRIVPLTPIGCDGSSGCEGPESSPHVGRATLTALYNDRPSWLAEAHRVLDEAVAVAYGWPVNITTDDALRILLDLNLARSAKPAAPKASKQIKAPAAATRKK